MADKSPSFKATDSAGSTRRFPRYDQADMSGRYDQPDLTVRYKRDESAEMNHAESKNVQYFRLFFVLRNCPPTSDDEIEQLFSSVDNFQSAKIMVRSRLHPDILRMESRRLKLLL